MSPLDVSRATAVSSATQVDRWLRDHGSAEREIIVAIFKKASGKQTVTFDELLETALCHGWSPTNREIARRLVRENRMAPAGVAALPADL